MINQLYRRHKGVSEIDQGLLQALLVLGDKIETATGTHPDAAHATFDLLGRMVLSAGDYGHHGNRTQTGDLIEELIERLDQIGGPGSPGGGSPEVLWTDQEISGNAPTGYKWGVNKATGQAYYVDANGVWQSFAVTAILPTVPIASWTVDSSTTELSSNDVAEMDTHKKVVILADTQECCVLRDITPGFPSQELEIVNVGISMLVFTDGGGSGIGVVNLDHLGLFIMPGQSVQLINNDGIGWYITATVHVRAKDAFDLYDECFGIPTHRSTFSGGASGALDFNGSTSIGIAHGVYALTVNSPGSSASLGTGTSSGVSTNSDYAVLLARVAMDGLNIGGQDLKAIIGIRDGSSGSSVSPSFGFFFQLTGTSIETVALANGNTITNTIATYGVGKYAEFMVYVSKPGENSSMNKGYFFFRNKGETRWVLVDVVELSMPFANIKCEVQWEKKAGSGPVKMFVDYLATAIYNQRRSIP